MMKKIISLMVLLAVLISCKKNSSVEYEDALKNVESLQMDRNLLVQSIQEADSREFINAVIVLRHNEIAYEHYFHGTNKNSYHNIRSVSKSFLSTLVGLALEKGLIPGLDKKVMDYFPEYINVINDQRFLEITFRHLLKMQSGLDGDDNIYFEVFESANPLNTIFDQTLMFQPGTKKLYSTASTHLLGCALARAVGMNLQQFANTYLFNELNIQPVQWLQDPQGNYIGGTDMIFRPYDLIQFGLLFSNGGKINGRQIISQDWVEQAIHNQSSSTGTTPWGALENIGYGYLWWTGTMKGHQISTALGHGGQFVMLVPDLDLLIITSSYSNVDWDTADYQERSVLQIIADYIIPAAKINL